MDKLRKNKLTHCSIQTQTGEFNKNISKNRMPSYQDLNLRVGTSSFYFNNLNNGNRTTNQLRGKKVMKKKEYDLYNEYINKTISRKKKCNIIKSQSISHEKGQIILSFSGRKSINRRVFNEFDLNKKHMTLISRKLLKNNITYLNNNLNKKKYKLPLFNIKKLLNINNNNDLSYECNNIFDNGQKNIYEEIKTDNNINTINSNEKKFKENFPTISSHNNLFTTPNIRKDKSNKLFNDYLKINLSYINRFKNNFDIHKKLYGCASYENNKFFKKFNKINYKNDNGIKEINSIRNNIKLLLYNYNKKKANNNISKNY